MDLITTRTIADRIERMDGTIARAYSHVDPRSVLQLERNRWASYLQSILVRNCWGSFFYDAAKFSPEGQ